MTDELDKRLENLKRALEAGAIDKDTYDAAATALKGQLSGAIAQGTDAVAAGSAGVAVGKDNYGNINTGVIIDLGTQSGASKADLRRAYIARILTQADQLPLFVGDTANSQIRLSSVYTALLTQRSEHEDGSDDAHRRIASSPETSSKKLSALDVLNAEKKLVLLGGPGSGKSTFVSFVALSMAGELLGANEPNLASLTAPLPREEDDREDETPQQWDHGAMLPVQIVLRDLASQLPTNDAPVTADAVWGFIRERLEQGMLGDYAPYLEEELHNRGGLVLLDGLDEVPDALNRRVQIKQAVRDFAATF